MRLIGKAGLDGDVGERRLGIEEALARELHSQSPLLLGDAAMVNAPEHRRDARGRLSDGRPHLFQRQPAAEVAAQNLVDAIEPARLAAIAVVRVGPQ